MRKITQEELEKLGRVHDGYVMIPPATDCSAIKEFPNEVEFGSLCKIGDFTKMGNNTIINESTVGAMCSFGEGSKIRNSIVGHQCCIEDFAEILNSIISQGAIIGANSTIDKESSIGDYCTLGTGCTIRDSRVGTACTIGNKVKIHLPVYFGNYCEVGTCCEVFPESFDKLSTIDKDLGLLKRKAELMTGQSIISGIESPNYFICKKGDVFDNKYNRVDRESAVYGAVIEEAVKGKKVYKKATIGHTTELPTPDTDPSALWKYKNYIVRVDLLNKKAHIVSDKIAMFAAIVQPQPQLSYLGNIICTVCAPGEQEAIEEIYKIYFN